MSHPRRVEPGVVLFITRRTQRRTFLFRPDPTMNAIFLYALAVTSRKFGIEVHAAMLMSTHEHLVVTDRQGNFPDFIRELHRLVALGTKVHRKWEGAVWDHLKTNVLRLVTPQAVLEKLAYTVVNPVRAGLVRRSTEWPGVSLSVDSAGREVLRVRRPDAYLDPENPQWPREVELEFALPEALIDAHGQEDALSRLRAEIALQEDEAHEETRAQGRLVLGVKRVLGMSPFHVATSFEPLRSLEPHLAAGRGQTRVRIAAIAALVAFRRAYRKARRAWARGLHKTVFPQGTWAMVQ